MTYEIKSGARSSSRSSSPSSSSSLGVLLRAAVDQAVPVVRAIPDGALGDPTPCAEYDVKALVNHLFHVVVEFRELAAKQSADFTSTPDRVGEGEGWREGFAEAAGRLVEAWSQPGAEEGTSGEMGLPARTVGCLVLLDLTVHGWDLARATGQEYRPDPAATGLLPLLGGVVAEMAPTGRRMGAFGEPVTVPEEADTFARLLGETGRDPGWRRPAR
ncbi:TIGR03086 family metal-binding protein [Streptomyces sp. NPDC002845]